MISKEDSELQKKIIEFIKINIRNNDFNYKLIFNPSHIIESTLSDIQPMKDIVLWHPLVAYDNLEIVKLYANSIVILDKPSLYLQKISRFNPINENMAINNGFRIIYINPKTGDITNDDWKIVVREEMYLMTIPLLTQLILLDETNMKTEKLIVDDVFESITDIIKNQINLS